MKKISWFKRLFWSWTKFESYFSEDKENSNTLFQFNEELKKSNDELRKDKGDLKITLNEHKNELNSFKGKNEEKEKNLISKSHEINELQKKTNEFRILLNEKSNQSKNIQMEINAKLSTLAKIEKTFFAQTGNKGKGELGEMQVKTILEKSGLAKDFWTENLIVGKNVVEFAIKSGKEGKWIPIDSKVIEADFDEDRKIAIIDKKYVSKVKIQAEEITKYLSKSNTAGYGVLVLQSDSIYIKLYEHFPNFFQEISRNKKVYIASPSSFVQMSWSIAQIVDIYDRVKNDEKIYNEMMNALDSVANFANSLKSVQKNFNIAMDRHFPAIENKHGNLIKRLDKTGKQSKSIKSIGIKMKDK